MTYFDLLQKDAVYFFMDKDTGDLFKNLLIQNKDQFNNMADEWKRLPSGALKVLFDKVAVEPIEAETTHASGLSLPENSREKPMKGIVVATNNKDESKPVIGDIVLYSKYAGVEINYEGKDLLVMRETDIFVVI